MSAQLKINYLVGYNHSLMGDMKDIAEMSVSQMNFELGGNVKMTDKFPTYISHYGEVTYQMDEHEFGIVGGYMSTGARYAYSDYSGKYSAKIVAEGFKIGLIYKHHFYRKEINNNLFSTFFSLAPSAVLTDVNVEEVIELYELGVNQKNTENVINSKFGFSIQPMIGCSYTMFKRVSILLNAGYDFELGSKIGPSHRVDWSGFRLSAGIGVSL